MPMTTKVSLAAVLVALAVAESDAAAKPARDLSTLDLSLSPGDVVPAAPPSAPEAGLPRAPYAQNTPEVVREVDQVRRAGTPNRRESGGGPLGGLTGDDGVLQELLEDKTIPLFRVRVEPPF
jgi:hypothetical protein